MNINLISYYDHFPKHKPLPFEPCIDMYNDDFVQQSTEGSCALLIEPRSICPRAYAYTEKNWRKFKYIFTHDSKLLDMCDNARLIIYGGGCGGISEYPIVPKTKNVSMVSSNKELCELHKARIEIARALKDNPNVDVMGTVDGGEFVQPDKIYPEYKFSVAFENYIDDYWFTEKICNCFANRVVPIYFGARKIDEFFNAGGIIHVKDWRRIPDIIKPMDFEMAYKLRESCIEDNYKRVQKYARFEDWFFNEYGELLNEC